MSIALEANGQWHDTGNDERATMQRLKQRAVSATQHSGAAFAHGVFDRIVRAWDSPRQAPTLYVVAADNQVWAASLDDGSIIITLAAVDLARHDLPAVAEARMAFVLAHELGHQRADHGWRQRYFGLSGTQSPAPSGQAESGFSRLLRSNQERQADAEGVVLMMLAGFDPFGVVGDTQFFDDWIASSQGEPVCDPGARERHPACEEALRRVTAAREQLIYVATQAALFNVGTFAFAAGDYKQALRCFTAFGRIFPAPSVHANIGLTHLAIAVNYRERLATRENRQDQLLAPILVLRDNPLPEGNAAVRGDDGIEVARLREQMFAHLDASITAFEKAAQLQPKEPSHYLYLAAGHLLADNLPMAEGILRGKYARQFAATTASIMIEAHLAAEKHNDLAARFLIEQAIADLQRDDLTGEEETLLFAAYQNLAVLANRRGDSEQVETAWSNLARWADRNNRPLLFSLARRRILTAPPGRTSATLVTPAPPMQRNSSTEPRQIFALWLDNEKLSLHMHDNGERVVMDSSARIVAAWNRHEGSAADGITLERLIARYGAPSRAIATARETYLLYGEIGLGFQLQDQRSVGWFRYPGAAAMN